MTTTLPSAAELVAIVKAATAAGADPSAALDAYAPAIDELADAGELATWLGISRATVYQERSRANADGSARWPAADARASLWRYRTIVLHRAAMPGQGSAGRGRPRRRAAA